MQSLVRLALRNPSVVTLATLIVAVAGIFSAGTLKQELLPDIQFPVITVITPYPLAGPEAVEQQVSRPLETALRNVTGVQQATSQSNPNVSVVILEFAYGTNLNEAEGRVSAAVNRVRAALPSSAGDTTVSAIRFGDQPVVQLALAGSAASTDLEVRVRERVRPRIEGIAGVARTEVSGARSAEVRVTLNPAALARNNLTTQQVTQLLQVSTLNVPVGAVRDDGLSVPARVDAAAKAVADLAGIVVTAVPDLSRMQAPGSSAVPGQAGLPPRAAGGGSTLGAASAATQGLAGAPLRPVLLSEVARIELTTAPVSTLSRLNGSPSIGLSVFKSQDANTVEITRAVEELLPELSRDVNGEISVISDQGEPITEGIQGLLREGAFGAVFAVLVVLVFLANVRSTLVTAISIPLSVLIALLALRVSGYSLNVLTLGGLTIAIGRVIDDSIVVIENIFHKLSEGLTPMKAAYEGAREVAVPVTASTITTVAVFLPLGLVSGLAGEFFRPLALAVTWSILASLLVAFTVVPLLASTVLKVAPKGALKPSLLERLYRPAITWVSDHRAATLVAALAVTAASFALVTMIPTNFIDSGSARAVAVQMTLPDLTPLETIDREARNIETRLESLKADGAVGDYLLNVGTSSPLAAAFGGGASSASITVTPASGAGASELLERLEAELPPATRASLSFSLVQQGGGGFAQNVEVQLSSASLADLRAAAELVATALSGVPELKNPRSNLEAATPEFAIRIDQEAAFSRGVVPATVSAAIRQSLNGSTATTLDVEGQNVPVVVASGSAGSVTRGDLEGLLLTPLAGSTPVPLRDIATIERVPSPSSITRVNGQRTASVTAEPAGADIGAAGAAAAAAVGDLDLPDGTIWVIGGVTQIQSESFASLGLAIAAAIAVVYLIMVASFRSLLTPLLLLTSIPLVAVGAFPALFLTGIPIGLPVFFGFLLLVGIVVTNGIVLFDLIERQREEGVELRQAVIEGGTRRVRPIVMTALATVLGLAPLAFGGSEGGAIVGQPLAVTVIGGLISSTLLTLLVVPALYLAVEGGRGRRGSDRVRRRAETQALLAD